MERPWQDKETLKELYVGKGMTTTEIGDMLGCGEGTVWRWLDKYDIERRNRGPQREFTKLADESWLWEQYEQKKKTAYEIADDVGCTPANVYYWLRRHNIKIRQKHNGQVPTEEVLTDSEWLQARWVDEDLSCEKIASDLDVSAGAVYYWCQLHGLEKPTKERLYYGTDWEEKAQARLEYDDYECVVCGESNESHIEEHGRRLTAHHIQPLREFKQDDGSIDYEEANKLTNLVTLCIHCHRKWEGIPLRPQQQE